MIFLRLLYIYDWVELSRGTVSGSSPLKVQLFWAPILIEGGGGLVSTGATQSSFSLFVELGLLLYLFQAAQAQNYISSLLKQNTIHV